MGYYINISNRDWAFVFIFGLVFGGFLGAFISLISGLADSILKGFITGTVFGLCIFLFSFLLINSSNKYLLKSFPQRFWTPLSLIVSFLSGSLGAITAYSIVRPLKLIGDMIPMDVALLGSCLIGLLTAVIGYLLYTIVVFRKKEMDLEKSVIESRLKALEYQINPHYLFNSLNVIAELVYVDRDMAEEAIIKLSKFLREVIEEDSLVSLERELDIVNNYLFIQTVRFPDIKVHCNIDTSLLKQTIPKLTLQILVENAIKHGVKSKGNIWIDVFQEKDYLIINVSDDGKDFKGVKEGVGLRNLKTRLSLLYEGDIMWGRKEGITVFTVRIKKSEKYTDN
ncbi:MAG: histidine kinase [Hydrogenothermaceae bacterium]|nr:histidine kinase [Hydrogenothermaceae bacterium]